MAFIKPILGNSVRRLEIDDEALLARPKMREVGNESWFLFREKLTRFSYVRLPDHRQSDFGDTIFVFSFHLLKELDRAIRG